MLRRLGLTFYFAGLVMALAGLLSPALPLPDITDCARFAGNDAIIAVQDTLMLTYLRAVGNMGEVVYAVSEDNGGRFTSLVVDSDTLTNYVSAPVITVNPSGVVIAFSRDGKTLSKFKSISATAFTSEPAIIADYADPLPLLKSEPGNISEAVTYKADSLETLNYTSLSNTSVSANGDPVYYSGPSEYWGKIHCNDDIWIKQEGGGTNNGWPIFHDEVTTSGTVHSLSPNPPWNQIFLGGYQQNTPPVVINESIIADLRAHATIIGEIDENPDRITFVTVNGNSYTSLIGEIVDAGPDTVDVWTQYPPRAGIYIFRNRYTRYDTIWTTGPAGSLNNNSALVYGKLWIKGNFAGKQTWGATGDLTIVDDICLVNTPLGQPPDGSINTPVNTTDYVALVSEKNIIIQYGYKEPWDSLRCYPNMGDVYVYASLFALGNGNGNPAEDGNITFEYQHPHPSTPGVRLDTNFVWNKIDLHRYMYPQTDTHLWPAGIDYPFYNPLWPESNPYLERGNLHIFGSLYQKRQGFWHLPLEQSNNPQQVWDIENQQYGGNSGVAVNDSILGITMQCVNYPGAEGDGIGYRKVLLDGDARLDVELFPDQCIVMQSGIRLSDYDVAQNAWQRLFSCPEHEQQRSKTFYMDWIALNNRVWWGDIALPPLVLPTGDVTQIVHDGNRLLFVHKSIDRDILRIFRQEMYEDTIQQIWEQPVSNNLSFFTPADRYMGVMQDNGIVYIYRYRPNYEEPLELYYIWDPQITGLTVNSLDAQSNLTMLGYQDNRQIVFYIKNTGDTTGTLYLATGSIENVGNEDDTTPVQPELIVYPNPFRQNMTIQVHTAKQLVADIAIYNIKGQRVATIGKGILLSKGENTFEWDGTDAQGREVSTGLYFLRSKSAGKTSLMKLLKIN